MGAVQECLEKSHCVWKLSFKGKGIRSGGFYSLRADNPVIPVLIMLWVFYF